MDKHYENPYHVELSATAKEIVETLEGDIVYVYEFDDITYRQIILPIAKGKYSQVDREYVRKYYSNPNSVNNQVLTKSNKLRAYWENKIGCTLPENAEVWSLPDLNKENYYGQPIKVERINYGRTKHIA